MLPCYPYHHHNNYSPPTHFAIAHKDKRQFVFTVPHLSAITSSPPKRSGVSNRITESLPGTLKLSSKHTISEISTQDKRTRNDTLAGRPQPGVGPRLQRMDTITIPSPTAFLARSPVPAKVSIAPSPAKPVSAAPKRPINRNPSTTAKASTSAGSNGVNKPKQSKSRNGCITCKTKRLKCDETKPTCQQCFKRNVTCGGYKKDFKWRSFEETTFGSKAGGRPRRTSPPQSTSQVPHNPHPSTHPSTAEATPSDDDDVEPKDNRRNSLPSPSLLQPLHDLPEPHEGLIFPMSPEDVGQGFMSHAQSQTDLLNDPLLNADITFHMTGFTPEPLSDIRDGSTLPDTYTTGSPPLLKDLLAPGTDMNQPPPPEELRPPDSPAGSYLPGSWIPPIEDISMDDDVEEISRSALPSLNFLGSPSLSSFMNSQTPAWFTRGTSPAHSASSSSSATSEKAAPEAAIIPRELNSDVNQEIFWRFQQDTCGILSVKNGSSENPWKTLVLPLVAESDALNHAIRSLTSLHISRDSTDGLVRMKGLEHMSNSIQLLNSTLVNTRTDVALATILALAFADSWDQESSTGIRYLRGARSMVYNALSHHQAHPPMDLTHAARLQFLINTWVYMDVIARLTSISDEEENDLEHIMFSMYNPFANQEVDPLLGCAATLFPIIGRVANLIGQVRASKSNDLNIISQATELHTLLERWELPSADLFDAPEDRDSQVGHALQTAEAYRYATMLYLHQAIPEIPCRPSEELAAEVLRYIATVPTTSRTTIIHIYPLLAASCEATTTGDRKFCMERWTKITERLRIANADKCIEVVKEVWRRRDEFEAEKVEKAERLRMMRGQGRFGVTSSSTADVQAGDKRKSFSSDDLLDSGLFFSQNAGAGFELPNGQYGSKRRAVGGHGSIPIPRRMSTLSHTPNKTSPTVVLSPGGTRRKLGESIYDGMEFEYTVRGRLHWLGVMTDWNWEILLG